MIVPWTASKGAGGSARSSSAECSAPPQPWPRRVADAAWHKPDRPVFQGLEAFEGAPCYREIVEKERDELEQ